MKTKVHIFPMELNGVGVNGVGGNWKFPELIYLKFTNPISTNPIKFWGLFSEVFRIYTKWLPQRSQNYPNHPFGAAKRPQKGSLLSLASLRQPFCIYSENFWEEASEGKRLLRRQVPFVGPIRAPSSLAARETALTSQNERASQERARYSGGVPKLYTQITD